jgi:hypothetical protein
VTDRLKTTTERTVQYVRRPFDIVETVADRDRNNPKPAIVVNCPPQTVDECIAYTNTTVAEDNPDYPADAPVIVVVYRHDLAEFDPNWPDHDGPFSLAELNEAGVSHYSFPAPRLTSLVTDDNTEATDTSTDTSERESGFERANKPAEERATNADATEDESDAAREDDEPAASEPEADPSPDPAPEPSAAVRALEQRLTEGGMTTDLEVDGQTIRATKLGETYRLRPGEVLDGDGALRSRLEEIVDAGDHHPTD